MSDGGDEAMGSEDDETLGDGGDGRSDRARGEESARARQSVTPAQSARDSGKESAAFDETADLDGTADPDEIADFDERVARAMAAIQESERRAGPAREREHRDGSEEILEYTTDRRDLHPSVQFQWGLWTSITVAILTAVFTGIIGAVGGPVELGVLIFVGLFVLGMAWVVMRYRVWIYQVREDSLYLERGVVTHRRTHVPYVRIQHVDTSRGPLERWLGLSTLVVYTAGSRGADVSIPGLEPDEARDLQQRVKRLAIEAEGDDAL